MIQGAEALIGSHKENGIIDPDAENNDLQHQPREVQRATHDIQRA
jgi:hypothetical protein